MEQKRNPKLDTFKQRQIFFLCGLIISLGLVLTAFEWKTYLVQPIKIKELQTLEFVYDNIEITTHPEPEKQAPPPPKNQIDEIKEVEEEIKESFDKPKDEQPTDDGDHKNSNTSKFPTTESKGKIKLKNDEIDDRIYDHIPGVSATPEGGMDAFYGYLSKNIKYPRADKRINRSGDVHVRFVVEKDGTLSNIEIVRSVSETIDAEAIRVLKECPIKWNPGLQRYQPVRVRMTIPIRFRLR